MKIAKKILASALAFLWLISMSACSAYGKKLTMDAFLKAETRDDIIDLLGEPSSSESGDDYYDHYDSVMYIGDTYSTLVSYYSDSTLCIIVMHYLYDGMRGMDSVLERLDYTVTAKDRQLAKEAIETAACELAEKYGDPEIYDSPVDTTTYSWDVGDCEIELADYTGNDQFLKVFGAYEIIIYY